MSEKNIFKYLELILTPTLIMLWSTSYFVSLLAHGRGTTILIRPIYYSMVVLYIINAFTDYLEWKKGKIILEPIPKIVVLYVGMVALYIFLMPKIGFLVTTTAFMYASFAFLKVRSKILFCITPVIFTLFLYILFYRAFAVPLPKGIFPF